MSTAKDFTKAIQDAVTGKTSAYDTTAEVMRVEGDTVWVHIPGGVDETPVKRTIDAKVGDTVQVRVGGGSAWLVGNASAPPTDDTTAVKATEIAVEASRSATDYVTDLKDGVFVHPSGDDTSGWKIAEAIELLKHGVSYIWAGLLNGLATIRIGRNDSGHTNINSAGMRVYGADGSTELANIGYGPGTDSGGGTSDAPYYTLGVRTGTIGNYSAAEGLTTTASGFCSHAEGASTNATNSGAHAEGQSTIASGVNAHAEGQLTAASGKNSHAQNLRTVAGYQSQTAIGEYNNNQSTSAFEIGNGSSNSARSNAAAVQWDGTARLAGDVYVDCAADSTGGYRLPIVQSGHLGGASVSANSYLDRTVTFDKAFPSAPTVVCSIASTATAGALGSFSVSANSITTTGFTARVFNASSGSRTPGVDWIAVY